MRAHLGLTGRRLAVLTLSAWLSSCGGRVSYDSITIEDDEGDGASGGSGARPMSAGGGPSGSGGLRSASGGAASGGAWSGGAPASGGTLASGGALGSGGNSLGGTDGGPDCSPFEGCGLDRAWFLLLGAYGTSPARPEIASCVDLDDDGAIDVYDYLDLAETWSQIQDDCPVAGQLSDPGSCLFPGDVDQNGCLDLVGDYKAIEAQLGQSADQATVCADAYEDGLIDEMDLAYVVSRLGLSGCAYIDRDPKKLIDGELGIPRECGTSKLGDLNGDDVVDYYDLYSILSHLGLSPSDEAECIDINRDRHVDLSDVLHYFTWGTPTTVSGCPMALDVLEEFVDDNKACTSDSDCAVFEAECAHVAEHCSRVVYLNASTDEAQLSEAIVSGTDCMSIPSCRRCTSTAPMPKCIMGRCGPSSN